MCRIYAHWVTQASAAIWCLWWWNYEIAGIQWCRSWDSCKLYHGLMKENKSTELFAKSTLCISTFLASYIQSKSFEEMVRVFFWKVSRCQKSGVKLASKHYKVIYSILWLQSLVIYDLSISLIWVVRLPV